MNPKASMGGVIYTGDALEILPMLEAESAASIVTDPPYGLSFMGKAWDHGIPGVPFWVEALRVAKPGAFLLAFGGTRTFHRLAVAIEDAGWEIRDCVMWVYGSGFPKSLNIQQAINKAEAGYPQGGSDPTSPNAGKFKSGCSVDNPSGRGFGAGASAFMVKQGEARGGDEGQWEGWGTALKPAWEPIIVARKPIQGTVAENVLKYGTGGMNIDGCRVETTDSYSYPNGPGGKSTHYCSDKRSNEVRPNPTENNPLGRWPANLIHDGSDEVVGLFPQSIGQQGDLLGHNKNRQSPHGCFGKMAPALDHFKRNDSGSAARFFYCAKASRKDRNEGMGEIPEKPLLWSSGTKNPGSFQSEGKKAAQNNHPTVKPNTLMRYLCRLVTPPGGIILDPFMGSGSTGKAAIQEGFNFIGIDNDPESVKIAEKRIEAARLPLFTVGEA